MAENNSSKKLHIVMFPWFAIGHMTPFLHLSNKLAEKGHKISFLLPNKAKLQLEHINLHPNLITFYILAVPQVDGIPPGTETASEIPIFLTTHLVTAMDKMQGQVKELLQKLKPSIVLFDVAHWIPQLASEIGFKTVNYNVVSAASLAIALVPSRKPDQDRTITESELEKPPPGYPSSTVLLRKHEAHSFSFLFLEFGKGITLFDRVTTAMKKSDAISIRTCREIEGPLCDYIAKDYEKPVLLTGPVLPESTSEKLEEKWENWLNGFNPGTVVFCAFGSQIVLEKKQFQELVSGLELTGLPFLIALKPPFGSETVEEALPEGFENRVRGRGIVHGGWVQQLAILKHPSVGCFVNHCGFGSMWESLMSDCQIVLVPHLADQILNTRLLAEELKVAVEIEREANSNAWFSKESLCRAIKSVMDSDSEVGNVIKKNHAKWKEILAGPSFLGDYVDKFIEELHQL
ncbi:OLC1v1023147C1 [Oldenlandia corymbosa var. corymbosa]|uniref:OLC1v1023147C1 n=1 Tax=Oldenlandia corymbosa var. corymbosa TaxID=529605 RepID=A0AAV1BZM5_OLDCO|nr:OLC1v1023147C1 [Oldenlandia corymbosa var. corymbosa]